jgi:hypothetical protein
LASQSYGKGRWDKSRTDALRESRGRKAACSEKFVALHFQYKDKFVVEQLSTTVHVQATKAYQGMEKSSIH